MGSSRAVLGGCARSSTPASRLLAGPRPLASRPLLTTTHTPATHVAPMMVWWAVCACRRVCGRHLQPPRSRRCGRRGPGRGGGGGLLGAQARLQVPVRRQPAHQGTAMRTCGNGSGATMVTLPAINESDSGPVSSGDDGVPIEVLLLESAASSSISCLPDRGTAVVVGWFGSASIWGPSRY